MERLTSLLSQENIDWVISYATSLDFLLQIGMVLLALLAGRLSAKYVGRQLDEFKSRKISRWSLASTFSAIEKISSPLVALIFLFFYMSFTHGTGVGHDIVNIGVNLIAAWVVIRFVAGFAKYKVIANWFAVLAWLVAALNILGVLDDVTTEMDAMAITVGESKISLLLFIKGLISILLLLWIANLAANFLERQLSQSNLNPSLRVLFAKIIKISFLFFAFIFGLNSIGIDLTALAVFSGALGVGLGFGLQKIVSNFISGIILLMDRSIKPGDVIAVEDSYGWVNKLSSRHVSVITRDGMEHLIPNELLITEKVENWSYSDKNVRIKVPFGVSYNADVHEVKRLVLEAVDEMPRILDDPKPNCLLIGFGDSSVDFELRVWINNPADGVTNMKSDVYFAIWDVLKENNIEIPFPQRDVHIKSEPSKPKKK